MKIHHFDGIYQERWGLSWAMLVSGRVHCINIKCLFLIDISNIFVYTHCMGDIQTVGQLKGQLGVQVFKKMYNFNH